MSISLSLRSLPNNEYVKWSRARYRLLSKRKCRGGWNFWPSRGVSRGERGRGERTERARGTEKERKRKSLSRTREASEERKLGWRTRG
ncbi:hypothetical protein PUN28_009263 [Cardiocondyla obscurior]|uniref:Uncharacterized protein n=1 Tax=Cardiocondyla obscurior TaxID=286306 RepID=A0AAW2FWS0_9HYME